MKKTLIALCLAVVAFTASARTIGFGVTAGMNVSKIDWDINDPTLQSIAKGNIDTDNGWYLGGTAMVSLPIIGLGADGSLIFSQEKLTTKNGTEAVNSIAIPLHVRYDINIPAVNNFLVPFVMAGPQFNYAFNDIDLASLDAQVISSELKIDNAESWKFDIGFGVILLNHLQVSYGYNFPIGKTGKLDAKALGQTINDASDSYKLGTHRLGVAYYF